jgi:Fe-S cluster biogenesis protein NfuA
MDEAQVAGRLERLDDLIGRLEAIPGATAELAMDAIGTLAEVYGEALRRIAALAGSCEGLLDRFDADDLIHHLLVLHDAHPAPVAARVERALESVRPYVESHGGSVELVGIDAGVAQVRLAGACETCAGSTATIQATVTDAVLASAPELLGVEQAPGSPGAQPLIPVTALLRRPGEPA